MQQKIWTLCKSSIPLSKETIENITELCDYIEITKDSIDSIKNKEVKTILCNKLGILPEKSEDFFRSLIYVLTGKTLIIKDKATIQALKACDRNKALRLILLYNEQYSIKQLSEIFNRFKPLFLALKTSKEEKMLKNHILNIFNNKSMKNGKKVTILNEDEIKLNAIINKISHLSKKYHKPMKKNDLDIFIEWCSKYETENNFEEELKEKLEKAGIWRVIKLKNYLQYEESKLTQHVYKIRNGKVWIQKECKDFKYDSYNVLKILDAIIIDKLKNNVYGKKVYLDEYLDLKLPQSEKQFIGNIPFGSSLTIDKENLLFAIQWFNVENNRVDLDLKLISNIYEIGWNANYKETDKLIFSGDVTDAPYPKGATECIYVDKTIGESIFSLKINNFTKYVDNIEYDIIISKGDKKLLKKNYIINPNDVIVKIPKNKIEKGKSEHSIGTVVVDNKNIRLIFADLCTANRIVSSKNELEDVLREFIVKESKCKCSLKDYLEKAGAIIIHNRELADINLSVQNLTKDALINLFA